MAEVIVPDARPKCQLHRPLTGTGSTGYSLPWRHLSRVHARVLRVAVILLTASVAACASHVARPEPFPRPRVDRPAEDAGCETPESPCGDASLVAATPDVIRAALNLRGRPYAPGGAGPDRFDCSGLVQFVYRQVGIDLPRTVSMQFAATHAVPLVSARAGDLLFFRVSGAKPSHVAIAIGDGTFVHAPSARGTVRVESLGAPYWRDRLESVRRVHVAPRSGSRPGTPVEK